MTRGHHEGSILQTLVYLAPAIALTARKIGQAIRVLRDDWKAGKLMLVLALLVFSSACVGTMPDGSTWDCLVTRWEPLFITCTPVP